MNRLALGILFGIAFGAIDVAMTLAGSQPNRSWGWEILAQAFFSRFAIGVLGANVSFRMHPVAAGALAGALVSLPDAFAVRSYFGVIGTGIIFGAMAGWAASKWGRAE